MDGIIIINKPKGFTSNNIVNKVKHLLNTKVGHTGTLDPNATGVLPLLLGQGTKFSKYLINHDKKYCAELKLGIKTTTADIEGEVVEEQNINKDIFDKAYINDILNSFIGKQIQTPPVYSAIKINGKKLYEYARNGLEVEVPKRAIEIYNIELVEFDKEKNLIVFNVECSKGTYIRSLCEDMAEKLGTIGYMENLNRLVVGNFKIEDSVTIDELENNKNDNEWIKNHIITLEQLCSSKGKYILKNDDIHKFINGVKLHCDLQDGVYAVYNNDMFVGSGYVEHKTIKRDIVINER